MGRQEGERRTRGVFARDRFQPWLSGSRRGQASSVDRHSKAGNHAVITTRVGDWKGSLTFRGWGLPALSESHIHHMLVKKLTEGKEALIRPAIPLKNKAQHPSSHTPYAKSA